MHLCRAHQRITPAYRAEKIMANSVGIPLTVSHEFMRKQASGRENLGFIPEDYRNYVRSKRTIDMKTGDTKADYKDFGDVVCFDTTYRKNNEGRPFSMLVGVNHHKKLQFLVLHCCTMKHL
ncbi:hypothetical protein ACH5RR_001294 [Cinchona calisaya]|uniref:Protein FAR1-RELATED SEQUENCE n=1 Tax=Cinchona calisaya TaxID=153742 RepID=A0ABD3B3N3_9GENT